MIYLLHGDDEHLVFGLVLVIGVAASNVGVNEEQ